MSALLVCDTGENYGLGHLSRSSDLLKDLGFLSADILTNSSKNLNLFGLNFTPILEPKKEYKIIVIDSYILESKAYHFYSNFSKNLICFIDSLGAEFEEKIANFYPKDCFIINTSNAKNLEAKNVFCGLTFAKGFGENFSVEIRKEIKNIICNFGSADTKNLTKQLLKMASKNELKNINFHLINPAEFLETNNVKTYQNLSKKEIFNLAKNMDLAISGAGVSLSEFLSIKLPTIAIQTAKNQSGNIEQVKEILPVINNLDSIILSTILLPQNKRKNIAEKLNFIGQNRALMLQQIKAKIR